MPLLPHSAWRRRITVGALFLALLFVILLIPESAPDLEPAAQTAQIRPFLWNQDARWDSLEAGYAATLRAGCDAIHPLLSKGRTEIEALLTDIDRRALSPSAPEFSRLEDMFFRLAPLAGTCPAEADEYVALASQIRTTVKRQSEGWDVTDRTARETLYRLIYGSRHAVEEVILQTASAHRPPALVAGTDEPSQTPAAMLLGVVIHSGDVLVSRGGAPTSALIARGNDFQGNFSHIALAYVDQASGVLSLLESHIERGVVVSTPDEYMRDTKLRVMVLRLRHDLPVLQMDPLLPHRAATAMRERILAGHIPYDFAMDYNDAGKLFCSEVASAAYAAAGVRLWMGMSHISSPGLRSWLADFGVRHFETQEPSDLEYDPQLRIVAEWRDSETLRKDHIDNAVTEAMLEGAERGDRIGYNRLLLPPTRVVKGYCSVLNALDREGPIPEGMSATSALKHESYRSRHQGVVAIVSREADEFRSTRGFEPPYWELLRIARRAVTILGPP